MKLSHDPASHQHCGKSSKQETFTNTTLTLESNEQQYAHSGYEKVAFTKP